MKSSWTDAEESLLEHLDGRYVGKKFVSEYKRLAAIKKLPKRSSWAIIKKAGDLSITLNGGVFDSFSCKTLGACLGVCWQRVHVWVQAKGLIAKKVKRQFIIFSQDFVKWAKNNVQLLGGISPENLFWLTGEILEVPVIPQTKSRNIIRLSDKTIFRSIREASRQTFIGQYSIYRALRFGNKAGGSKWEYVTQCN
jgi:hypothetical protein